MTAADVAFTFNLTKKNRALDLNGTWSVLSSVKQQGNQVAMTFKALAVTVLLLHRGSGGDRAASTSGRRCPTRSRNPVNTRSAPARYVRKCTPQNITYKANPNYWQTGPAEGRDVSTRRFTSNDTANDDLANGHAQWGSQFIPGIKTFYLDKSPNYHYWFPPDVNVLALHEPDQPQLKNVKVRQAISYAINRGQVSTIGESGYEPPANQTGIVTPTFSSSLDNSALSALGQWLRPGQGEAAAGAAGYHMAGGVMTNAAGQKLAFTVIDIGDYSDWVASMQVIQQNLKAVGIQITPQNLSNPTWHADLYYGKYRARLLQPADVRPERVLRAGQLAQLGEHRAGRQAGAPPTTSVTATKATDALLNQYATTTSASQQHTIVNKIQEVMLGDGADHPGDRGGGLVPVRHR